VSRGRREGPTIGTTDSRVTAYPVPSMW